MSSFVRGVMGNKQYVAPFEVGKAWFEVGKAWSEVKVAKLLKACKRQGSSFFSPAGETSRLGDYAGPSDRREGRDRTKPSAFAGCATPD